MEARQLIRQGSYGPERLSVLFKAFDDAWEVIAPSISGRADAIEAARMKLANVILALAQKGHHDAEQIKTAALRAFGADNSK